MTSHNDERPHTHYPIHQHGHVIQNGFGWPFVIAIGLNLFYVLIEFVYGFIAHSTALMADAGHNFSDVLGLLLSWGAVMLARRQPTGRYTYGFSGTSILAALANGMLLWVACGAIAWEAISRMAHAPEVHSLTVMVVASIGVGVNGLSAWLFMAGRRKDLNINSAFLHMVLDAAVSLGVVLSGWVMLKTGWFWLDPLISLVIVVIIVIGTWGLLSESVRLVINAVPEHIDVDAVLAYLTSLPGVEGVHDVHIWALSTTQTALTVHLVMPGGHPGNNFIDQTMYELAHRFSIDHSTLQVETVAGNHVCVSEPA